MIGLAAVAHQPVYTARGSGGWARRSGGLRRAVGNASGDSIACERIDQKAKAVTACEVVLRRGAVRYNFVCLFLP